MQEPAPLQQQHAVDELGDAREVVVHDDDAATAVAQAPQHGDDRRLARAVDAREGLVEQQQLGVLRDGAGDERALALPARERADLPIGEALEAEQGDRLVDGGAIGGRGMRSSPMRP